MAMAQSSIISTVENIEEEAESGPMLVSKLEVSSKFDDSQELNVIFLVQWHYCCGHKKIAR